ncbi:MAG: caspase family protein, partial [Acidobacteriota bacterium]|nr:caspase family protein [Acidobacteriota bacterium]
AVPLTIEVVEPYGHDAAPISFELTTRAAEPPVLVLTDDFAVEGAGLPVPRDTIVTVRLRVRNVGRGEALDVVASIRTGDGVFPAHDSQERFELGEIGPGAVREIAYRCYANQRAERLALHVDLSDERTRTTPAESVLTLPLANSDTVPRIVRVTPDPRSAVPAMSSPPPPLTSDVDRFIPEGVAPRLTALAVVLGIESYVDAPPATYAAQDARTAARYFENAMGIPPERVELLLDEEVTLAQMNRLFGPDGWLARRVHEDTDVFVFFAGHGVAEGESFDPYLVPTDGDLSYIRQTGFSLDRIVERLAALDAGSVTLLLDACFSGLTREGDALLAGARRLVVAPVYRNLAGVSVYSAARGSQVAHSLDDQGHGLFSYYVFKGLSGGADLDGDRRVMAGELAFFLEDEIPRAAARIDREQAPAIFLDDGNRVLVSLP